MFYIIVQFVILVNIFYKFFVEIFPYFVYALRIELFYKIFL